MPATFRDFARRRSFLLGIVDEKLICVPAVNCPAA
jgi:hypothetical protein